MLQRPQVDGGLELVLLRGFGFRVPYCSFKGFGVWCGIDKAAE